jgi:hypothetical protein
MSRAFQTRLVQPVPDLSDTLQFCFQKSFTSRLLVPSYPSFVADLCCMSLIPKMYSPREKRSKQRQVLQHRLLERFYQLPKASYRTCSVPTRLVKSTHLVWPRVTSRDLSPASKEVHRTYPVKDSPNGYFKVVAINRPPNYPLGPLATQKLEKLS